GGADVAGGFELELVRRQALHADRRPVARRAAAARIVAQADRAVPPWSGGVAPGQFRAGMLEPAVAALALAAQPELVEVAPDARAQVPAECIAIAVFEPVAAKHRDQ